MYRLCELNFTKNLKQSINTQNNYQLYLLAVRVDYQSTPKKLSVTSSSASVSWPQSERVPPGLESYYQYVVEYADGQGTETLTRPFIAGQGDQSVEIKGLKHNTNYYIKVRIDARHNNQTRQGSAGQTLTLKTTITGKSEYVCLWCHLDDVKLLQIV